MASFVLERLWGDGSVETTKRVNIAIHLFNGVLVYWLFRLLLTFCPGERDSWSLPFLCTAIWLLAPLQVSTVLYQVQRMAMLAATFSLLSVIAYLYWRRSIVAGNVRWVFFGLALLAGVMGLLSKENAVTVVPLLLITEIYWLQFQSKSESVGLALKRLAFGLTVGGGLLVLWLLISRWGALEQMHELRDFTLKERILTQLIVLWDYVRQFFIPDVSRLGLYHDDVWVPSMFWRQIETVVAGIAWVSAISLCLLALRWPVARRLAFGPLFFLVGHSLESTVWPLELYFEHRNYLPSVGLAMFFLSMLYMVQSQWRATIRPLKCWTLIYCLWLAMLTTSQVTIWSNQNLLALQHVVGHPESARANRDLAHRMAELGVVDGALDYSKRAYLAAKLHKAASDEHYGDFVLRNIALACIAGKPLSQLEFRDLGSVHANRPLGDIATMKVVVDLYYAERCPEFQWNLFAGHLQGLYLLEFDASLASARMFSALAALANALERWEDAYGYTARSLKLNPDDVQSMLMQLHFSSILNKGSEVSELKNRLLALKEKDKLSRSEEDTLAFYTES
ncbi:MAG: hypothetical protein ABJL54_08930 [Halioglobus sp.]